MPSILLQSPCAYDALDVIVCSLVDHLVDKGKIKRKSGRLKYFLTEVHPGHTKIVTTLLVQNPKLVRFQFT